MRSRRKRFAILLLTSYGVLLCEMRISNKQKSHRWFHKERVFWGKFHNYEKSCLNPVPGNYFVFCLLLCKTHVEIKRPSTSRTSKKSSGHSISQFFCTRA